MQSEIFLHCVKKCLQLYECLSLLSHDPASNKLMRSWGTSDCGFVEGVSWQTKPGLSPAPAQAKLNWDVPEACWLPWIAPPHATARHAQVISCITHGTLHPQQSPYLGGKLNGHLDVNKCINTHSLLTCGKQDMMCVFVHNLRQMKPTPSAYSQVRASWNVSTGCLCSYRELHSLHSGVDWNFLQMVCVCGGSLGRSEVSRWGGTN